MFQRKTLNLSERLDHLEDLFILSLCFCGSRKIPLVPQPPDDQEIVVYVCGRHCCRRIPSEVKFVMKQSRPSCETG